MCLLLGNLTAFLFSGGNTKCVHQVCLGRRWQENLEGWPDRRWWRDLDSGWKNFFRPLLTSTQLESCEWWWFLGTHVEAGHSTAPKALGLDTLGGEGQGGLDQKMPKNNTLSQVGEAGEVWSKAVDSSFNVQVFLTNKKHITEERPYPHCSLNRLWTSGIWGGCSAMRTARCKLQLLDTKHFTICKDRDM